jgi:uncharacterized protein (DUF433 family)
LQKSQYDVAAAYRCALWYNSFQILTGHDTYNNNGVMRQVMDKSYHHIITIDPNIRSGKPIIRGLRYTVYDILSYLAAGMTVADILDDFPDLTEADIQACLEFAADRERHVMVVPA